MNPVFAQERASEIDEAIALYRAGRTDEAAARLRALVARPKTEALPAPDRASAYTYLAMSAHAIGLPEEAASAAASAIQADGNTFLKHGESWAARYKDVMDSAAVLLLRAGIARYDDAEFAASASLLESAVAVDAMISPVLAAKLHAHLAFNYVAMRRSKEAQQAFRTALMFDPTLDIGDESVIAPKIRREFLAVQDDALKDYRARVRRNTLLRSLFLPGWGQIYRGERWKGYAFMTAEFAMVTGTVLSLISYNHARSAYEGFDSDDALSIYLKNNSIEDVSNELQVRFHRYESKSRQANAFIGLAIGVWSVNLIDALILTIRRDGLFLSGPAGDHPARLSMDYAPDARQWTIRYRIAW